MGLLTIGKPLEYSDSKEFFDYIKEHGIEQFINLWKTYQKAPCGFDFKWGDEVEYLILHLPERSRTVYLSLRSKQIQEDVAMLMQTERKSKGIPPHNDVIIHPEYGSFMIEGTPKHPYGDTGSDLLLVEQNMYARRHWIGKALRRNERLMTLTAFPLLGVGRHLHPHFSPGGQFGKSQYVSDAIINPHPRFRTLTKNIRDRRGKKVDIRVPLYRDKNTDMSADNGTIHMDAMGFGMGCCCLQVTFQCRNVTEARHLYDQLAVLGPIMAALTAATPVLRGKVSDYDLRWTVISQSVDDRTDGEKGLALLSDGQQRILKSRYDTIDSYISNCDWLKHEYNDLPLSMDHKSYQKLRDAGVDELMAQHVAHLFVRDPLVVYSDLIDMDDTKSTHHFETIQSTNWQNVRFKPPPFDSDIGWRVEFRTMEVQITSFENAAFSIFVALVSRAILYFELNFYIPISRVDENMKRAHFYDAARKGKFYWRTCNLKHNELQMDQLTIEQVMVGCSKIGCKGLLTILDEYLKHIRIPKEVHDKLNVYLTFIRQRACGEILTTAQWIRKFIYKHPMYKQDSVINQYIARDLVEEVYAVEQGAKDAPELLGKGISIKKRRAELNNLRKDPAFAKAGRDKLLSRL